MYEAHWDFKKGGGMDIFGMATHWHITDRSKFDKTFQ